MGDLQAQIGWRMTMSTMINDWGLGTATYAGSDRTGELGIEGPKGMLTD